MELDKSRRALGKTTLNAVACMPARGTLIPDPTYQARVCVNMRLIHQSGIGDPQRRNQHRVSQTCRFSRLAMPMQSMCANVKTPWAMVPWIPYNGCQYSIQRAPCGFQVNGSLTQTLVSATQRHGHARPFATSQNAQPQATKRTAKRQDGLCSCFSGSVRKTCLASSGFPLKPNQRGGPMFQTKDTSFNITLSTFHSL